MLIQLLALPRNLKRVVAATVDVLGIMLALWFAVSVDARVFYLPSNWNETYATADIIAYDGKPRVKLGREFLLRRPEKSK